MEPLFKLAAVLMVFSFVAIIGGILTSAEENVTPVNETTEKIIVQPEVIKETPEEEVIEETPVELTPEEEMAIREGEIREEEAAEDSTENEEVSEEVTPEVTEGEDSQEEENVEQGVTPSDNEDKPVEDTPEAISPAPDNSVQNTEVVTPAPVAPVKTEKSIFAEETPTTTEVKNEPVTLSRKVDGSGYVFIGKEHAGKVAEITVK